MPPLHDSTLSPARSIMIADVVSSTALYEQLGDRRARAMIAGGIQSLCEVVRSAGGWVVKSLGDGILTSFETDSPVPAALEMVQCMSLHGLEVRVGIHYGPVIEVEGDVFGDVVNTAARISALARASEILISKSMWERLSPETRKHARRVPSVSVKGKREPLQLYSILDFDEDDQERNMTIPSMGSSISTTERTLRLEFNGQHYELQGEGVLNLGRGRDCEVSVMGNQVSRMHAKIFYRRPDFVLVDSSTNGTFLVSERGSTAHILRRETILFGRGKLYPGAHPNHGGTLSIAYEIR